MVVVVVVVVVAVVVAIVRMTHKVAHLPKVAQRLRLLPLAAASSARTCRISASRVPSRCSAMPKSVAVRKKKTAHGLRTKLNRPAKVVATPHRLRSLPSKQRRWWLRLHQWQQQQPR